MPQTYSGTRHKVSTILQAVLSAIRCANSRNTSNTSKPTHQQGKALVEAARLHPVDNIERLNHNWTPAIPVTPATPGTGVIVAPPGSLVISRKSLYWRTQSNNRMEAYRFFPFQFGTTSTTTSTSISTCSFTCASNTLVHAHSTTYTFSVTITTRTLFHKLKTVVSPPLHCVNLATLSLSLQVHNINRPHQLHE